VGNGDLATVQEMLTSENLQVPVDCLSCIIQNDIFDIKCMVTTLVQACQGGNFAVVQELLCAGADVNWKDEKFIYSPLHKACHYGKSPEVVALLAVGADINANC